MERMLRPTCTCPGIIPDLEPMPIKLRTGSLRLSYDPEMYSDPFRSEERFARLQFACAAKCFTLCAINFEKKLKFEM